MKAKHAFHTVDDRGDCGEAAYCRGRCGTHEQVCSCGFKYSGNKSKEKELMHVLEVELKRRGLYG